MAEPATSGAALRRGGLRPTRRMWATAGIGAALYVAGANVAASWVLLLAALALGVVPLAAVSAWRSAARLQVWRDLPARAVDGEPCPIALEVTGDAPAALVVHDHLSGTCGDARAGQTLAGTTVLSRGVLRAGEVEILVSDPFGLVEVLTVAAVPASTTVAPRRLDLTLPRSLAGSGQLTAAPRRAPAGETVGVRDHVVGEPLVKVHWRSSARRGALVVRETADPEGAPLDVALSGGVWSREQLDLATSIAAAVAAAATDAGQQTSIAADGERLVWGARAENHLAGLPPHAAADARPLDPPPVAAGRWLALSPTGTGVAVHVADRDRRTPLGVIDQDADAAAWIVARLEAAAW